VEFLANYILLIIIAIPQEYQPRHHRIRCQGHILNLATNAFLSVSDIDQIDDDNTNMQQLKDWKRSGPLGKLHNLYVKIHTSPQLLAKFKTLSKGLTLPQDNSTRWNSWHKLVERGLYLQKAIDQFHDLWLEGDDETKLESEDWATLQKEYIPDLYTNIYTNLPID
jgi:hypothetical protein